jgi:toxin ParE1/3/4
VKPVALHDLAEQELLAAAEWYEARAPGLGEDLVFRTTSMIERISEAPNAFPRWDGDTRFRKAKLERFPYTLFYQELEDEVRIVAVAHGRREPGYWLRRR